MKNEFRRLRSLPCGQTSPGWLAGLPQDEARWWLCCGRSGNGKTVRHTWWFIVLILFAGCYDDRGLKPTEGVVTFEGSPVTTGVVTFYPTRGRPASAKLDTSGRYQLASFDAGDGVAPGEYRVTIKAVEIESVADDGYASGGRLRWLVPQKYSEIKTTPLQVTISDESAGRIDFELPVAANSTPGGE